MKLATTGCVAFLWPTLLCMPSSQIDCVAVAPVRLCGTLHGKTTDPSGAVVRNVELRVVGMSGVVAAEIRSDSNGRFVFDFSSIPAGTYEVTTKTTGWQSFIARIVTRGRNFRLWRRPLVVRLGFEPCMSGVGRGKLI
jgi:hypothetical protein